MLSCVQIQSRNARLVPSPQLHQFMYVHGKSAVELQWGPDNQHSKLLQPGDSAFVASAAHLERKPLGAIRSCAWLEPAARNASVLCPQAPMVPHRFNSVEGNNEDGQVYMVRIPGLLTSETLREYAMFQPDGRERVGAENVRWYS